MSYACSFAKLHENLGKVLIFSYANCGNVFPVTEFPSLLEDGQKSYYGSACRSGYQSHYTLGIKYYYFKFLILLKINMNIELIQLN